MASTASSAALTASATQRARCSSVNSGSGCARAPGSELGRKAAAMTAASAWAVPPKAAAMTAASRCASAAPWWRTAARAGRRRGRASRRAAGSVRVSAGRPPAHSNRVGSAGGPGRGTPRTSACRCRTACSASGRSGRARSAPGTSPRRGDTSPPSASVRGIPPVIRYGPSWVTSIARSRVPCQSARSRSSALPSALSKARLSAPDGQSRTARTSSSRRPPLGATNGSAFVRKAVGARSVHRPECWQMPRLSKIVTCAPG